MSEDQCACKGIRTCLVCEESKKTKTQPADSPNQVREVWHYCLTCADGRCYKVTDHSHHSAGSESITISGVYVKTDFVNEMEEEQLIANIDRIPWVLSQSGRRKHDFGPKVNFKKKKLRMDSFLGFPMYSRYLLDRMASIPVLKNFQPVEMCNLEYEPSRGSAIDPHYDDFWLWGERLVTINLLSDTAYTLILPENSEQVVKVPLPKRSITVLYSDARYMWMHAISRDDITKRRLGITIRELTPLFLDHGEMSQVGKQLLEIAKIDILEH